MTIRVVARAVARPDTRAQLHEALREVLAPTRAEPGCIRYVLAESVTDPNELVVLEEWRSDADVQAHLQTAHVQALFAKVPALLAAAPDIRIYRVLDDGAS